MCMKVKPVSEFYFNKTRKKHCSGCKLCNRASSSATYYKYHSRNLRRIKKYFSSEKGLLVWRKASLNSRINNPEKWMAREKLHEAIRQGKIKRLSCEMCGETKSHGHHEDYSKPLEVVWLCMKHHLMTHGRWSKACET